MATSRCGWPGVLMPWWATLTAPVAAQATFLVPNGADLAPWIAQASPGDVLQLVAAHPPFVLTKGLTLLGDPAGSRIVNSSPTPALVGSTATPPAGQAAHLVGVQFESAFDAGGWVETSGDVIIDACSFLAHGEPAVRVGSGGTLLQDCSLRCLSRWSGLHVYGGAIVTAIGCEFVGAPGWFDATNVFHNPQPGIASYGSVWVSHSTITGGSNAASLVGFTVWLQAAQFSGATIYTSAPVGGVVR